MSELVQERCREWSLTLLFQEDTAFRYHDWNIAVDVALPFVVEEGDCDIGVADRGV